MAAALFPARLGLDLARAPSPRRLIATAAAAARGGGGGRPPSRSGPRREAPGDAGRGGGGGGPRPRSRMPRFVAEEARRFVQPGTGTLLTTRENADFFRAHDIEPDNGRMQRLAPDPPGLAALAAEYRVVLAFSRLHVVHPHDVRYFDPRGHPLAAMKRLQYARKKADEPLWILFTVRGVGTAAVVRGLTRRRLVGALHGALARLGYARAPGLAPDREIRGTLWISMLDPIATAARPADRFGRELAAALDREFGQPLP